MKSDAGQMTTVQLSATGGRLTPYSKRIVARSWYTRGKGFLGAAVLLRRRGGHEDVVLHLICQGIEIVLKSLLLFVDYDAHKPRLKKYRHDLAPLAADVLSAFKLNPLRPGPSEEIQQLSSLYAAHLLRYSSPVHDIFLNVSATIPTRLVLRRVLAGIRLTERELARIQIKQHDPQAAASAPSAAKPPRRRGPQ
jgi:hypothetical protein